MSEVTATVSGGSSLNSGCGDNVDDSVVRGAYLG